MFERTYPQSLVDNFEVRIMHIMLNGFWWPVDNFPQYYQEVRGEAVDNFWGILYKVYYVKLVGLWISCG